jgi:hypothetical protein
MFMKKIFLSIIISLLLSAFGTITPILNISANVSPVPLISAIDVPIYQNSFEDIDDLGANGITSEKSIIKISTENVDFASGKKALEVSGTLSETQWSSIYVDFTINKLFDGNTIDLSDKTIGYSSLIPSDSPIDGGLNISVMKEGKVVTLGGGTLVPQGDSKRKGVWQTFELDVAEIYANGSWAFSNLSGNEAKDVIKNCETILIHGGRSTPGPALEAKFYLDNLNWIKSDRYKLPVEDSIESLRKLTVNRHFRFGLYSDHNIIFGSINDPYKWKGDPWYAYKVAQEGSVNVGFDFPIPEPGGDYSNLEVDPVKEARVIQQYDFGETYSMKILGYGIGVMYSPVPDWIKNLGYPEATKALLLYHVEKQLNFTKGQEPIWIMFNEFILPIQYGANGLKSRQNNKLGVDGHDYGEANYYSPWAGNKNDSSLIEAAFFKAHSADPDATLLLNDANNDEQIGQKMADYLFQFATGLKNKGVPVNGVGFQLHNSIEPNGNLTYLKPFTWPWQWLHLNMDTYLKNLDLNVKRYADKGLKVAFTEVEGQIKLNDIDLLTPKGRTEYEKRLQWQAKYYAGLLKIAMKNENVILFHSWGVTDRYQNLPLIDGYGNGFIFDKNYNPKPAYSAMLEILNAK